MHSGNFDFDLAIETLPLGQKRTGKNKKFSFLTPEYVYKGAFKSDTSKTFLERCRIMASLKLPFVVLPEDKVFMSTIGAFLRFPNVDPKMFETMSLVENIESWEGGYKYKVAQRQNLVKLSDYVKNKHVCEWIYSYVPEITVVLCVMYLLNCGDVGVYNMLVDINMKKIYIIDFDENRGKDSGTEPLFYFAKLPAEYVKNRWLQEVNTHKHEIIAKLKQIDIEGIDMVIQRLTTDTQPVVTNVSCKELAFRGVLKGIFQSKTYSGITIDIAKSALQKFIRRCFVDESLQIAFELFQFSMVEGGKAIVTNFCNRLCVIAAEDIGVANVPLVYDVINTLLIQKNVSSATVYDLVYRMAISPKSRLCSHLSRAYMAINKELSMEHGLNIETTSCDPNEVVYAENFFRTGDDLPDEMIAYANLFIDRVRKHDFNAFVWLQEYMYNCSLHKYKVRARNRRTKAEVIIWRMLETVTAPKNDKEYHRILPVLEHAFWNLTERRPFISLASALAIKGVETPISDLNVNVKSVEYYIQGDFEPLTIPEWVLDIHTRAQSRDSSTVRQFRRVGALVNNEDMRFCDKQLKAIYEA
jgi:hypothetical protein